MKTPEIISKLLNDTGLKASQFAKSVGLVPTQIYDLQTGKTKKISPDVAEKILNTYPQYQKTWLLTGETPVIKDNSKEIEPVISLNSGTPYYNVDFLGGFDMIFNDQTINPEYYIQFKPYEKATCWCNITGHSMEPEINSGDIIALRRIEDFSFIPYGEIYAIVTKNDMRTIKRIGPSDNPDNYTLIPTNRSPEYGVQELPKAMILAIFEVMGCMKRL